MARPAPIPLDRVTWLQRGSLVFAGLALLFLGFQRLAYRDRIAELDLARVESQRLADRLAQVRQAAATERQTYAELAARIVAPPPPVRPTAREDALTAGRLFVAEHPEANELVRSAMVTLAQSWPARAGRAAGFSDAQIAQWKELFARQKGAPFYSVSGLSVEFGELDSSQVQGSMLREIVGDALFARYQDLRATSYGRSVTARIANQAASAGLPLTPAQINALAAAFGPANLNEASAWDDSAKRSAGVLSPEQQVIFDEEAAVHRAAEAESNYRAAFLSGKKLTAP